MPLITGVEDQSLLIDVTAHVGTLLAVLLFFYKDVARLFWGGLDVLRFRWGSQNARLALMIFVATLPVVVAGLLLKSLVSQDLRSPLIIALTTALFGAALWFADSKADQARSALGNTTVESLTWKEVILIGLAQAIALIPGVSRSGITLTAALLCGMNRVEAARFSLLMAIPAITAAGSLAGKDLYESGELALQFDAFLAMGLSFSSAVLAISLMMRWLKKSGFGIFVAYRLALAGLLAGAFFFDMI